MSKGVVKMARNKEAEAERVRQMAEFDKERSGGRLLAGIDEAGRGPLAGPVYAAAVILPPDTVIEGLNDSKKLSEKKREELFDVICDKALSYSVYSVDEERIDDINILQATFEAMRGAAAGLDIQPEYVLIDGDKSPGIELPHEPVIKGDGKSMAIAAASILAKVSRDRFMKEASKLYPGYGFEKHKGYGTAAHYEAIRKLGVCKIHRRSFLKKLSV